MRPRLLPLVCLLLVPVLLSGCGDGDGDGDGGKQVAPTPTPGQLVATASAARAEYAAAADAVCTRATAAGRAIGQPATNEQYVDAVKKSLAVGEEALKGLQALTPPAEDAAGLQTAFLAPLAEQVAKTRAKIPTYEAALKAPDVLAALRAIADPAASVTIDFDYVDKYGMPACAILAGKR
jgi:hypothetical protein